jgi:hypothetical protein
MCWPPKGENQGVTKRCRLSWLTKSDLVYEPKCGGGERIAGPHSANEYLQLYTGAQIKFGDLTPYLSRGLYIGKYPGGGNKYGLMGKKYHENNARADKKGEKERKDKGKEKINDKKTEQEQCFIKLLET